MEPFNDCPDHSDELIRETLQEHFGPPPGRELWERIAHEISAPPRRSLWRDLLSLFEPPLVQSVMVLAVLAFLVVQPAHYWMQQDYPPAAPIKIALHTALKQRPMLDGDPRFLRVPAVARTVPAALNTVPATTTPMAPAQAQ